MHDSLKGLLIWRSPGGAKPKICCTVAQFGPPTAILAHTLQNFTQSGSGSGSGEAAGGQLIRQRIRQRGGSDAGSGGIYTILYYSILFYTILYYSILFCTILYWQRIRQRGGQRIPWTQGQLLGNHICTRTPQPCNSQTMQKMMVALVFPPRICAALRRSGAPACRRAGRAREPQTEKHRGICRRLRTDE